MGSSPWTILVTNRRMDIDLTGRGQQPRSFSYKICKGASSTNYRKSPDSVCDELKATKLMIEYDAAADLRPWRNCAFDGRNLRPLDVAHEGP